MRPKTSYVVKVWPLTCPAMAPAAARRSLNIAETTAHSCSSLHMPTTFLMASCVRGQPFEAVGRWHAPTSSRRAPCVRGQPFEAVGHWHIPTSSTRASCVRGQSLGAVGRQHLWTSLLMASRVRAGSRRCWPLAYADLVTDGVVGSRAVFRG